MTTPNDQVKGLRGAIERQKAARDAAREAARAIDRERAEAVTEDSDRDVIDQ